VQFYRDLLGMKLVYGGETDFLVALARDSNGPILNLEQGQSSSSLGRLIFYVSDVTRSVLPEGKRTCGRKPQDLHGGERYFSHV